MPALYAALLLLATPVSSVADAKPEVKSTSFAIVRAGKPSMIKLYGDNLSPCAIKTGAPGITARILEAKNTAGADKSLGGRIVTVEAAAASSAKPGPVDLTLTNPDGAVFTLHAVLVPASPSEAIVKRPAARFAEAMPVPGPEFAATGTLANDAPDLLRIDAKAGEKWRVRLISGSAGSALDALLRIRSSRHIALALDAGAPKRDRQVEFTAPSDGPYYVEITDAESRGGPTYAYYLTIRRIAP